jgi:hypothetical protein
MNAHFTHTSLLVAAIQAEQASLNSPSEECMGRLARRPSLLRDRLTLEAGQLMIAAGEKLTAISLRNIELSQDPA